MKLHNSGKTQAITVLTTPTLVQGHTGKLDGEDSINNWAIANVSAVTVYLGYDDTLTTANGFPLFASEKISEDWYTGNVYAIVVTGTAEIRAKVY